MNRGAQGDDLVALRQIAALHPTPAGFDGWLHDALLTRRDPDGVVLATVHRVKGQEWRHVIVHMAQSELFPHRLAADDEEERRPSTDPAVIAARAAETNDAVAAMQQCLTDSGATFAPGSNLPVFAVDVDADGVWDSCANATLDP